MCHLVAKLYIAVLNTQTIPTVAKLYIDKLESENQTI